MAKSITFPHQLRLDELRTELGAKTLPALNKEIKFHASIKSVAPYKDPTHTRAKRMVAKLTEYVALLKQEAAFYLRQEK
jgi:hypothetical protein